VYDAEAKRELVLASRKPGVSISRLARDCGINANQLSTWVRQHERQMGKAALRLGAVVDESGPTFLPVQIEARPQGQDRETSPLTVRASLPNGVILDLRAGSEKLDRQISEISASMGSMPGGAFDEKTPQESLVGVQGERGDRRRQRRQDAGGAG
jgi:transposase